MVNEQWPRTEFIRVSEVETFLSVDRNSLKKLAAAGKLVINDIVGKKVSRESLIAYLSERIEDGSGN